MEKKTIGAFIATLRKANGYTQEKLAEMLNVSNKAVSRWERDECAPDISLIPVIAEIFGVTCDELLKGERIAQTENVEMRSQPKVEKQMKMLFGRAFSSYKMFMIASLLMAILGFFLCLGISYGFYRPVIGFVVLVVFSIAAVFAAVFGITQFKTSVDKNDMLESVDFDIKKSVLNGYATIQFNCFFLIFCCVLMSIPLVTVKSNYVNSVLSFDSYIMFALMIAFVLVLLYFALIDVYRLKITESYNISNIEKEKPIYHMSFCQLILLIFTCIASVLLITSLSSQENYSVYVFSELAIYIAVIIANVIIYLVLSNKNNTNKNAYKPFAIRNILQAIPVFVFMASARVSYHEITPPSGVFVLDDVVIPASGDSAVMQTVVSWNLWLVFLAIVLAVAIFIIFSKSIKKVKNSLV